MSTGRLRLLAVSLALAGQVGAGFGLPVIRGSGASADVPDAACGCCPADRAALRCCCFPPTQPAEEPVSCCSKKAAREPGSVVWVLPTLRAGCLGPNDTTSPATGPVGVPPEPPVAWSAPADDGGLVPPVHFTFPSRSVPPDEPPPRGR